MSLLSFLERLRTDPTLAPNVADWRILPPRAADLVPLPPLPDPLPAALIRNRIHALYRHQAIAFRVASRGEHLVLATGTASGKTLAYNLPVLATLLERPQARALYLFPTKALAQDQRSQLLAFHLPGLSPPVYDGDTPTWRRSSIRQAARLLLTNPDMLHSGILPHHTRWEAFFRQLSFVVLDEIHSYRGVFGSHVANVIRRLKRIAAFYGARPQFLLASATIGNPQELAQALIEEPVTLIDQDGSARGEQHFLIYNPPVVDPSLGLRASAFEEALRLARALLQENVQSILFARSRRTVELLLTLLTARSASPEAPSCPEMSSSTAGLSSVPDRVSAPIRGYRSGYLPSDRREIEQGLRQGTVRLAIATNALELGIDIGGMEAALLLGYPGSIASTWQQAGRAGRRDAPSLAMLIASSDPLDQYLARHPEYLFGRSPEQALVNPDHLLILLAHLRCALFELPFKEGEGLGRLPPQTVRAFLEVLIANGEAYAASDNILWMSDAYPATNVSLRSVSPLTVTLHVEREDGRQAIGEVDYVSALWLVHPHAVYLHEGRPYFVRKLDLECNIAFLEPADLDYYTEPVRETTVQRLSTLEASPDGPLSSALAVHAWGELRVVTQTVGFRKRRWWSGESLGEEPLDLPPSELHTTGYWLSLSEGAISQLRQTGAWTNDPNDYGPEWPALRQRIRARDGFRCRICGVPETDRQHDVHHKIPFRFFLRTVHPREQAVRQAHHPNNLITLCVSCHRRAEQTVRMRSGLAGLGYLFGHLAPLFLMCDPADLGLHVDAAGAVFGAPSVVIYDQVPAGIGFSQKLFERRDDVLVRALEQLESCPCRDGCPSCVGPAGEDGLGSKAETGQILRVILGRHG